MIRSVTKNSLPLQESVSDPELDQGLLLHVILLS